MVPDVEDASGKVVQEEQPMDQSQTSTRYPSDSDDGSGRHGLKMWHVTMIRKLRGDPTLSPETMRAPPLWQQMLAEIVGTTIYVMFGLGSVAAAVVGGATSGTIQILAVWAVAITMGIMVSISISGAHLNPAVTLAFAILRPEMFPAWKLPFYWVAQLIGGMLGAGLNYLTYANAITQFESAYGIVRGEPASALTASMFHGLYPSPTTLLETELGWSENTITAGGTFGIECFATGYLVFIVFALMDPRNHLKMGGGVIAFTIGLSVMVLGCVYAPLEGMGINPARDLGPRIVAYSLGWGEVAIPGPNNSMWIWIIGPLIGGPLGGAFYDWAYTRGL